MKHQITKQTHPVIRILIFLNYLVRNKVIVPPSYEILIIFLTVNSRIFQFALNPGGRSLYITGVTSLASKVEVINPPIITHARGE